MTSPDLGDLESFFASATAVTPVDLCPGIELSIAGTVPSLWRDQENWFGRSGLPPPYWGVAWPGGLALARYILDNPALIRGRTVLDVGSGCGLCAIAAALSGGTVTAADTDPMACVAIAANARLNRVEVAVSDVDPVGREDQWDVVLAADLWYERFMAGRITAWLRQIAGAGTDVYLGDLGRAYFPRRGVIERGCYRIEGTGDTERDAACEARAWHMPSTPAGDTRFSQAVVYA